MPVILSRGYVRDPHRKTYDGKTCMGRQTVKHAYLQVGRVYDIVSNDDELQMYYYTDI